MNPVYIPIDEIMPLFELSSSTLETKILRSLKLQPSTHQFAFYLSVFRETFKDKQKPATKFVLSDYNSR